MAAGAATIGTVTTLDLGNDVVGKQTRTYTPFTTADVTTTDTDVTLAVDCRGAKAISVSVTSTDDTSGGDLLVDIVPSLDGTTFPVASQTIATADFVVPVDTTVVEILTAAEWNNGWIKLRGKTATGTVDIAAVVAVITDDTVATQVEALRTLQAANETTEATLLAREVTGSRVL